MSSELEKELKTYTDNKDMLVKHFSGKHVVVMDTTILVGFSSFEQALKAGLAAFGNVPMLIKEIKEKDDIIYLPSCWPAPGQDLPPLSQNSGKVTIVTNQGDQPGATSVTITHLTPTITGDNTSKAPCDHSGTKTYAPYVLASNPPQYPWVCNVCGAEGRDRGHYIDMGEYDKVREKFHNA